MIIRPYTNPSSQLYLGQEFVDQAERHLVLKLKVGLHERHGHPEHCGQYGGGVGDVGGVRQHAGVDPVGGRGAGPGGPPGPGQAVGAAGLQMNKR